MEGRRQGYGMGDEPWGIVAIYPSDVVYSSGEGSGGTPMEL